MTTEGGQWHTISVVILIRTDTTLDQSQKAEKVQQHSTSEIVSMKTTNRDSISIVFLNSNHSAMQLPNKVINVVRHKAADAPSLRATTKLRHRD